MHVSNMIYFLVQKMYHHYQNKKNLISSRAAFFPEKHLFLRRQNVQSASGLVLPTKPRLKWTPELHERFIEAVTQLGGADSKYRHTCKKIKHDYKYHYSAQVGMYHESQLNQFFHVAEATPKTVMTLMGIPGLTLYHLKSHLQVFSDFHKFSLQNNEFCSWRIYSCSFRSTGLVKICKLNLELGQTRMVTISRKQTELCNLTR